MTPIMSVTTHAQERAAQRLGRALSRREWLAIILDIVERRALLLGDGRNGQVIYLVEVGSVPMRVVWSPERALALTVLPEDGALYYRVENAKRAPIRPSFRRGGVYLGGEFRKAGTEWQR